MKTCGTERVKRRRSDNPTTAEAFAELKSDYQATRSSRFRRTRTGYTHSGSGADYHYRSQADYLRLIELARDMDRNDCIVGQMIDRAVINMIQDGITLDPQTGDEGLNKEQAARWVEWCAGEEACDLAGEMTFYEMEHLVPRQVLVDGDTLALPQKSGELQLVEGHRLRTPANTRRNVVHGVLLDEHRRRMEYWLTKDDVDPMKTVSRVADMERYPARDADGNRQVFHVYNPKRITQTRGVTALAPIFDLLGMFEDINFAKLVQQQVVSCFAVIRERDLGFDLGGDTAQKGARTTGTYTDGTTRNNEGISPGMDIPGLPGEKLQMASPNVPNPEFFSHVKLILTLIGINIGMPLVMVLMDASETNFSGWRGAVNQARLGFRRNQKALIRRFHTPVYRWKVRQWLADDPAMRTVAAKSAIKIFGHRFNPPSWPYIEPLKDAAADLLRTRNALISHRRRAHERGMDWDDLSTEIVEDNAQLIRKAHEKATELNNAHEGLSVTWREVASLPTPDGVKVTVAADSAESPAQPKPKKGATDGDDAQT